MIYDALFWKAEGSRIRCYLCSHHCLIGNGRQGLCSVRVNQEGSLKTINYGEITSMAVDPIEKKPLYHFKPGKRILSVGTFGCNFTCSFCQNYSIAHLKGRSEYVPPEQLAACIAVLDNNIGIAFTYNEPTIWFEFVYDTARKAKELYPDRMVALVTNGYIGMEALNELLPFVDAMNIDLKSFREEYYRKICGGDLQSVQKTIEEACRQCHVEVTTLLVNGLNDSMEEVEDIAAWLAALNKNIPLHLTRYYPAYRMNRPATDPDVMDEAAKTARKHLNYVYLGNMADQDNSTRCPECGELLIDRAGYSVRLLLKEPECPGCGAPVPVVL
jgi:pyruvate formate lyase activating enzyme